jgi:chromosome segregation ATPase
MQKYTISEIERKFGYSNSKIRRLIKKRLLPITKEKRDNRDITIVLVEDEQKFRILFGDYDHHTEEQNFHQVAHQVDNHNDEMVQEAEIIKESTDYQLMSIEQKSFDQLIQSIKDLADDRYKTEKESYKKLEDQYFSLQQDYKMLLEKVDQYKVEAIQAQAEVKILELRINESKEKIEFYKTQNANLEKKINELQYNLSNKEEELKNCNDALTDCQNEMQIIVVQKADLQGDLQDTRETIARLEKQNENAITEAQEFEKERNELEAQLKALKERESKEHNFWNIFTK